MLLKHVSDHLSVLFQFNDCTFKQKFAKDAEWACHWKIFFDTASES